MELMTFLNSWSLIFNICTLICVSLAIASPEWFIFSKVNIEDNPREKLVTTGLWTECEWRNVKLENCFSIDTEKLWWLLGERYLIMTSCFFAIFSFLCTLFGYWYSKPRIFSMVSSLVYGKIMF